MTLSLQKTASGSLKMTSEAAGTSSIIFNIESYPCMPKAGSHSIQGMANHSGQTRKRPSVSKNGLGRPQNDLGGCRDQVYHFQYQKLPPYAQSREPFQTGHGRLFRTNTQTNSSLLYFGLKMTSEATGTRPIIFNIKSYPCMPKVGSHSIQGRPFRTNTQTNSSLLY